jgi:hypothetical protein
MTEKVMVPYLKTLLDVHISRFRTAMRDKDRGASATELALITAGLVALAFVVLIVVMKFIHSEDSSISSNADFAP